VKKPPPIHSSRRSAVVLVSALVAACARSPAPPGRAIDREAEAYVRLALALGERDPDSLDSYFGPPEWREEARAKNPSLAQIRREAVDLTLSAASNPSDDDEPRRAFLRRQLGAIVARVDVITGTRRAFADESRLLFGVDPPALDRAATSAARDRLNRLVPGRGDLTRRIADFQRRFLVPPDRVPRVFARAIDECRRVTLGHQPLPNDERVSVEYVGEYAWSAFTRYEGGHRSRITVNTGVGHTVDDLLQLACHETYPGHHLINVLLDDRLVRTAGRRELAVQLLFTPQSLLAEGAASVAPQLAFADEERLAFERAVLFPLANLDAHDADASIEISRSLEALAVVRTEIAERYLDGGLEFARAADAFEHEALMPQPVSVLKFLNEYRSYAVVYARGPALASAYIRAHARSGAAARWSAYVDLVTNASQAFEK
jgi:hypothetical protein